MDLGVFFGAKRRRKAPKRSKKSPGRKPKRAVKKLRKSQAYVMIRTKTGGLRKRKLYVGKNGGLYYRTKSGRVYVSPSVLKRKKHILSPKKRKVKRAVRKLKKRKAKRAKRAKMGKYY